MSDTPLPVVYTAGAFTAPTAWRIEQNIRCAEEYGLEVARLGASPLIPHANTRFFHGEGSPEFWYRATEALLLKSDAILMLPNWTTSRGAVNERSLAEAHRIKVCSSLSELKYWLARRQQEQDVIK